MPVKRFCTGVKRTLRQGYDHLGHISNCHGVPDFYKSDLKPHKILWALALLCSFGAIIYYFVVITRQFIENPTATKITEISVETLAFPNVTVCKYEKLSVKNLMAKWAILQPILTSVFGTTSDAISFGGWALGIEGPTYIELDMSPANVKLLESQFQVVFNQSMAKGLKWDVQDFLRATATQCSELFSSCKFGAKAFNCCSRAYAIFSIYGVCYHMVPMPRRPDESEPVQHVAGNIGGLHLELFHNDSDVPIYPLTTSYQKGYFITVASYFSMFETDTVSVSPGSYAYVSLTPVYRILNEKKNRCTWQNLAIGPFASNIYTYRLCQGQCYYNASRQMFGCYVLGPYLTVPSTDVCSPYNAQRAIAYIVDAGDPVMDNKMRECTNNNCSQLCNFWSYPPSVTYSSMVPTSRYLAVPNNQGIQMTSVDIYYQQLMYTMIEQQLLMDFSSYLSGLGGALGLFAGMSILTFVQCCATFLCMPLDRSFRGRSKEEEIHHGHPHGNQVDVNPSKSQLYDSQQHLATANVM